MNIRAVGLNEAISFFKDVGPRVDRAQREALTSPAALRSIQDIANAVTDSVVYSKFIGKTDGRKMRDGALALSVDEGGTARVLLGMEMDPDLLTTAGAHKGQNTYAMFMLPEYYSDSFLKRVPSAFAKLPADFLSGWHDQLAIQLPDALAAALDKELSR